MNNKEKLVFATKVQHIRLSYFEKVGKKQSALYW